MSVKTPLDGGCQCGAVRYRIHGEAEMLYACHCSDCQKQSASAFGLSLRVDPAQLEILQGEAGLRHWDTRGGDGAVKRCAFCAECGTRIYHGSDDATQVISVKGGSLDDTSWLRPIAHIWLRSAQPWFEIDRERFRCFDGEPADEDALRRLWRAQNA